MKSLEGYKWSDGQTRFSKYAIYSKDSYGPKFGIIVESGKESSGCKLRIHAFCSTLIVALPDIIVPQQVYVDTSQYSWGRGGYTEYYRRSYGFQLVRGALHYYYGPQTDSSDTEKSGVWFYPWRDIKLVRHSLYGLSGKLFTDLPLGFDRYDDSKILESACPKVQYTFHDYDGEEIVATCTIHEREYASTSKMVKLFKRNSIDRTLQISFNRGVGHKKSSWKGGVVGTSIKLNSGELHESAFRRYCNQNNLTFVGSSQNDI